MNRTLTDGSSALKAKPVDDSDRKVSTRVDIRRVVQNVIADAGWKQDAVAAHVEVDASLLSRQLNGERKLDVDQVLERLPEPVFDEFAKQLAEQRGYVVLKPSDEARAITKVLRCAGAMTEAAAELLDALSGVPGRAMKMQAKARLAK